ncbi:hypothetical protein VMCG_04333 [Cytospora schulzeri]|uniref:Uncharacterized protein n=1 Tax=Cytospora schulzeri TaxID=448051 RepID=A0A423WTH5_9PEZI|nr:hypothetical protein VMCG_04333 [Valsa malicola]
MADQVSEILEAPREFVKDGMQFSTPLPIIGSVPEIATSDFKCYSDEVPKTRPEGVHQVLIMGFVGYVVKLIHIPLNNILVGGA